VLPAGHRLRRGADISTVVRRGRRAANPGQRLLVVHTLVDARTAGPSESLLDTGTRAVEPAPRAGFVVGRSVGGSVVRHRVIRRLRHLVRPHMSALPAGTDVVVRALPAAAQASYDDLARALDAALRRALPRQGVA
jgi:ribonuclease P protein component